MEVVASLSQGRTAAAQCGLFTHKSVPVIFEPPCISETTVFSKFTFYVPCIVIRLCNVNHVILTRYWLHCVRI